MNAENFQISSQSGSHRSGRDSCIGRRQPAVLPMATEMGEAQPFPIESCALKRILLIDDEAHVLRVMRLSLERNGYEVDTALNGEFALRMLQEEHYSALIISAEFAVGQHGLCDCVQHRYRTDAPLMMVMVNDGDEPGLDDLADAVERIERPVSLRWIVSRLNEYFGDYENL